MAAMSCPFCASGGQLRLDKKDRPYWSCLGCGSRVFLHTDVGFLGFALVSGMVGAMGRERWTGEIAKARGAMALPPAFAARAVGKASIPGVAQSAQSEAKNESLPAPIDR